MTGWNVSGLSPQHQQVSFKIGESSKSVDQFQGGGNTRPDTLYRFKSGNIEIKAGATVLRNRGLWNSFKSKMTSVAHFFTTANTMRSSKSSRALRRAEAARDTAVSTFVADVANGKLGRSAAMKRLGQIADLNTSAMLRLPRLGEKGKPVSFDDRMDKTVADLGAVFRDAIQTAMEAMPDKIDVLTQKFDDIFADAQTVNTPKGPEIGNASEAFRISEMGKLAMPGLTKARFEANTGKKTIEALKAQGGDHKQPLAENQATALAKFAAQGLLAGSKATDLQKSALDDLKARCAGGGINPAAVDFVKAADHKTLGQLMQQLHSFKRDPGIGALCKTLETAIASDMAMLKGFTLPPGDSKPQNEAWLVDTLAQACTLTDDKGRAVHSDEALEAFFDDVYAKELPSQASRGYFRTNEATIGFCRGMLDRYSGGQIHEMSHAVNRVLDEQCAREPDFVPEHGPNVKGAPHPEFVMQTVNAALDAVHGFNASPKFQRFLQKLHDGFTGRQTGDAAGAPNQPLNDKLPGEADRFVRSSIMLRSVVPDMKDIAVRNSSNRKARDTVSQYALTMFQGIGNSKRASKVEGKGKDIAENYIDAVKREQPQAATKELEDAARRTADGFKASYLRQFEPDSTTNQMYTQVVGRQINLLPDND
ncbi:MAG: hypothetical protein AAF713_02755 [Pseudomonadota bacterium]